MLLVVLCSWLLILVSIRLWFCCVNSGWLSVFFSCWICWFIVLWVMCRVLVVWFMFCRWVVVLKVCRVLSGGRLCLVMCDIYLYVDENFLFFIVMLMVYVGDLVGMIC